MNGNLPDLGFLPARLEEIVSYPRGKRKESKAEERVESPQAGFLASFLLPGF